MNTREREVMDALAAQLRIAMNEMSGLPHSLGYEFTHIKKMDEAITAYDALTTTAALLAEGSASSEGSEQRPIADEVMELSNSLDEDAALLRGLIDDGVDQADSLDRIADSMERASELLKSALPRGLPAEPNDDGGHEHAQRHGVFIYEVDFGDEGKGRYIRLRDFNRVCERGLPAGSDALPSYLTADSPVPDDFRNSSSAYIAGWNDCREARRSTAEQPSCGQDADMAALDWIEAMHTLHGSVEFLYVVDGYEVSITKDDGNSWTLLGSGPTLRDAIKEAIAAQQRQGEQK